MNNKQHILIAIISMDSPSLNKLLMSIQKNIDIDNLKITFMVFMNNKTYEKPILNILGNDIIYLPLLEEDYLNISLARNFLQNNIIKYCKKNNIEPIIWLLDEDIEIDKRANEYLPTLHKLKKKYDVLIGTIEGDSPNSAFSGINVQLLDLIHNINYLDTLQDDVLLPNMETHNQVLREKYPDYYYDLSSSHTGHLKEYFYITPLHSMEKVCEARIRIYSQLKHILSGKNVFRPIKQNIVTSFEHTLLRGANTFILNIDTLKIKQPNIEIKDYTARRSDMLWALINKQFCNKRIVKVSFPVLHNRKFDINQELSIQKTIEENSGSIIFNSLKKYYDENQKINFDIILQEQIKIKSKAINENLNMINNNIKTLENLNKPELKSFILKLKTFYTTKKLKPILEHIHKMKNHSDNIFKQFINYKPLILGVCKLETLNYELFQYDIGNEDIKIFTKIPLEDIKDTATIRMHSSCCNSEVFKAVDCDCASQLEESMNMLSKIDNGILFYINQEGRGHGYAKKIAIVGNMQTKGIDTYEACRVLGLDDDIRSYEDIANILKYLKINTVTLASNNKKKIKSLENNGIKVIVNSKKLPTHYTHLNIDYLYSKQNKGGHKELIIDEKLLLKKYTYDEQVIEFYEKEDNYGGFSNFSYYPFYLEDICWRTSEHYYQANKFKRNSKIYNSIQQAQTPTEAKKIAYSNDMHYKDWDKKKILFMHNALLAKFRQNKNLKKELLNTGSAYIIEKAKNDSYWGSGLEMNGKNILGRLLMFIRDEIKE